MTPFNNQAGTQLNNQFSNQLSNSLLLPQVATATLELIINKALSLNNKSVSFAVLAQKDRKSVV